MAAAIGSSIIKTCLAPILTATSIIACFSTLVTIDGTHIAILGLKILNFLIFLKIIANICSVKL